MRNSKNYLIRNAEQMLALVILVGVPVIAHFVPYKLVFLNFFFIVILFSVYFVEAHKALMGGVLTTLLVAIFVYYFPSSFVPTFTELDLWMNILAWSSFLILTGAAVGKLADRLKMDIKDLKERKGMLEIQVDELKAKLFIGSCHTKRRHWPTRVNYPQKLSRLPSPAMQISWLFFDSFFVCRRSSNTKSRNDSA